MAEAAAPPTVEVNGAMFCDEHKLEVCTDCPYDGREENDAYFGHDAKPRGPLEFPPYVVNKDGKIQCKKHSNIDCKQCTGWKKQIQKLQHEAKKGR